MRKIRSAAVFLCAIAFMLLPAAAFADTSFAQLLGQLEQQYQLPPGILWKVALAENGGKATGCASTSSACGMFQFITSTWESSTKAMFGQPMDPNLRNSPDISAKVAAYNLAVIKSQIGSVISQANVNLSAGLYLGHFLGSGGARALLLAYMQNPGQSACALLPPQCAANRSVLSQTVSGVINWASQKMSVTGAPNVPGNFADAGGISYAYSYADIPASGFLPANTVIPANPYGQYATVFPSVTNGAISPALTGASLPVSTQPATQSTSGVTTGSATAATSGSQCTPQYYCSNNTVSYESDSCSTSVFEECSYGCLGTICAPAPSASSTPLSENAQQTTATGSSTFEISETAGSSGSDGSIGAIGSVATVGTPILATSSISGEATSSLLNSEIYTIVQGQISPQESATATSDTNGENPVLGDVTLTSNGSDQTSAATGSPFSELLVELKSALTGFLSYLGSL